MAKISAGSVVLVTGASTGIGAATAKRLSQAGCRVFGTSRKALRSGGTITMLPMDVRDAQSVAACVGEVIKAAGRIDALVNNAGFGIAGSVEDTSVEDMLRQFDTNVFGAQRVFHAVVPHMRMQGAGRVILVSSLAARVGIPFQGAYSASKAALSRLGEALSIELAPFAIEVVSIEPGDTQTEFTGMREWTEAARTSQTYGARARHAIAVMEASERKGAPADKVARVIEHALMAERPKLRYVSTSMTERALLFLLGIIPARAFESLMRAIYEPPKR